MKTLSFLYLFLLIGFFPIAKAEEVTLPVVDGMILELGNYVQHVKVRSKSLSPIGFCGVTFELLGKSTSILSPPATWSSWVEVGPAFLGSSNQKLNFTVNCDTNAVAQVKFSK